MNMEKAEGVHLEMWQLEADHKRRKMRQESAMNNVVCEEVRYYMGHLSSRATECTGGAVVTD